MYRPTKGVSEATPKAEGVSIDGAEMSMGASHWARLARLGPMDQLSAKVTSTKTSSNSSSAPAVSPVLPPRR